MVHWPIRVTNVNDRVGAPCITVIGGGLAGCEAAWQAAQRGVRVRLHEMRPLVQTGAHETDKLAELVCSNSLKSDLPGTAPHLLKAELRLLGSLAIRVADSVRIPAGQALAVDRRKFSAAVTEAIERNPMIQVVRGEVVELPEDDICVVATGPLTSRRLSASISRFAGAGSLYFYDAISPIVEASTIDRSRVFSASRYGKGGDDYLNAPMSAAEYDAFYDALIKAESVPLHAFEETRFFEGCLPIEELARRGRDTLRFGPMKPVGLKDPRTGRRPYANVQLRLESAMADSYNIVGFQNHLRFPEQRRVFRLIPGLEKAEFLRFGQVHRNTYLQSPLLLHPTLQSRKNRRILFAGQICGVEGYVESIATGLLAGINAGRLARGYAAAVPPRPTACGSLVHYITHADPQQFQPANISFGLLPGLPAELEKRARDRYVRRRIQSEEAMRLTRLWIGELEVSTPSADAPTDCEG
ncbi:MAG: methylenetetrahydrofolate--tRNA-(uracil(54)-C(5))-methyltransferase (FADH(2)-oxidizing) TrmFO [Acidobacteria bacterium]|nr:methylenetetrahydrofolate--tRNA-(uracil(54)-C(5))-methyltransferase (FADH(2)-oxidizing) TrmFO [Acidobacteriota bacterium]